MQGLAHATDHLHRRAHTDGSTGQAIFQRLAFKPFHDQVVLAVGRFAVGDVTHDGRMRDASQAVCLLLEALAQLRTKVRRNFHGDGFAGGQVDGAVHGTHAAGNSFTFKAKAVVKLLLGLVRRKHDVPVLSSTVSMHGRECSPNEVLW